MSPHPHTQKTDLRRMTKDRDYWQEQAKSLRARAEKAEAEVERLREEATLALGRVEDQLTHDAPEWEHDHEDNEPWNECRACTYDAMLRDVKHAHAALAGSPASEGSPQAPRKLDEPVEYVPSLQRRTDDVRRRALAERVRLHVAEQFFLVMERGDVSLGDAFDKMRALDLDALMEEP